MGMTEVYVVRHGETDWNRQGRLQGQEDIPLNEKGRAQALACGRELEKTRFQEIFTSPLSRARETAEKIAQFQACPVSQDTGLLERDYGVLSGLTLPQREALAATGRPDGMEPWESLAQRALSALNRCADAAGEEGRALLVSHGAWINALLALLSGHAIGTGKTVLKNTCVSVLRREGEGWQILSYNELPEEMGRKPV